MYLWMYGEPCLRLPRSSRVANIDHGFFFQALLQSQLNTHSASPNQNDGDNYLPVVDGDFLPAAPSTLMREGRFAKNMRTIIGWTDDDAVLFVPTDNNTPQQTRRWLRLYLPAFTEAHLDELLSLYPSSDFKTTYFKGGNIKLHAEVYRVGRIFRDLLFTCQPIWIGMLIKVYGSFERSADHVERL